MQSAVQQHAATSLGAHPTCRPMSCCVTVSSRKPGSDIHHPKVQPLSAGAAYCLPSHQVAGRSYDASTASSLPRQGPRMVLFAPSTAEGVQQQQQQQQQQQHGLMHLQQNQQLWLHGRGRHAGAQQADHDCDQQQQAGAYSQPMHVVPAAPPPAQQQHHKQALQQAANGNGKHPASHDPAQACSVAAAQQGSSSSSAGPKQNRRGAGVGLERYISTCIKQCSTLQQVDAVAREYGPAFNIIHISAAITHLAQLAQRPQTTQQQQLHYELQHDYRQQQQQDGSVSEQEVVGLSQVTSQMAQQHLHLQQQLANPLQQAQLIALKGRTPSSIQHSHRDEQQQQQQQQQWALASRLLEQALPKLQEAGSRQVANMLWALSVLQYPCSSGSSSSSNGISQSSTGAQQLMARAAQLFGSAEAQHLSNIALAAAKLRLPVSQEWLQQLTAAWLTLVRQQQEQQQRPDAAGSGSRSENNAVGQQGVDGSFVSSSSSHGYGQAGVSGLQRVSGAERQASVLSASVSAAEQAASRVAAGIGMCTQGAVAVSPQATCNFLWALVQLQHQPQEGWLQEVVAAATPNIPTWPGKNVAMFMWACARLGYRLQSVTAQAQYASASAGQGQQEQQQAHPHSLAMLSALQACAHNFSSRDVSQALWAAAVMRLQVTDNCLQLLLTAGQHARLQQQQQQLPFPSGDVGHSVSVLLWSVGQLRRGSRQQLPAAVLQPWLSALSVHAAAAPGQSLGVAAWAAGQLGLTATCPQLVLRLVQAAARRQHTVAQPAQQQEQREQDAAGSGSSAGSQVGPALELSAAAAILWSAARCVVHAQKHQRQHQQPTWSLQRFTPHQQQQQQQQQHSKQKPQVGGRQASVRAQPPVHAVGAWGSTSRHALAAAAAAAAAGGSRQTAGAGHTQPSTPSSGHSSLQWAIKAAATTVAMQVAAAQPQQQGVQPEQQLPVWQLAVVLWSCSVLQLPLPAPWWHLHLQQVQAMLRWQDSQQHGAGCSSECAQALAVTVWALGRSRTRAPAPTVCELQQASLGFLQQRQQQPLLPGQQAKQQQCVFSQEGLVLLLLGFTRLATTAAAQLPRNTPAQRDGQHKRYRLLREKLQLHTRPGRSRRQERQQQRKQQQQPGASSKPGAHSSSSKAGAQGLQQQQQRHTQQRRRLGASAARRSAWWRQHLQQRRGRAVLRRVICQRQRHGWVAAAGLRASWLQAYCMACCPLVPDMGPDSLVSVLWALGRLRFHPGRSLMAAAQQRVGQLLPSMRPRHIALLLWALARLNTAPDAELMQAVMHSWESQLAYASMADMQQVVWAQRQLQLLKQLQQAPA